MRRGQSNFLCLYGGVCNLLSHILHVVLGTASCRVPPSFGLAFLPQCAAPGRGIVRVLPLVIPRPPSANAAVSAPFSVKAVVFGCGFSSPVPAHSFPFWRNPCPFSPFYCPFCPRQGVRHPPPLTVVARAVRVARYHTTSRAHGSFLNLCARLPFPRFPFSGPRPAASRGPCAVFRPFPSGSPDCRGGCSAGLVRCCPSVFAVPPYPMMMLRSIRLLAMA